MKKLFIITNTYPYGYGENFFEIELKYLAEKFNHIYILSLAEDTKNCRELGSNVKLFNISIGVINQKRIKRYIKFITYYLFPNIIGISKHLCSELKYVKNTLKIRMTVIRWKYLINFIIYGIMVKSKIKKILIQSTFPQDQIILYSFWCFFPAYSIVLLKKEFPNIKTVSRIHGFDLYFQQSPCAYIPFRKYLAENLDKIIFGSNSGMKYYIDILGYRPISFHISRMGVKRSQRLNLPSEDNCFRLLSASQIIPLKRLELIAKALVYIDFNIQWTHLGGEKSEVNEIIKCFSSLLSKKTNVSLMFKGHLQGKDYDDFFVENPIDCFINVSISEGVPVTIMEAFSFGIPVIATNVGGVSEIVNDSNGILLPSDPRETDVASAIEKIRESGQAEVFTKRQNAFHTWEKLCNAENNYREFSNILNNL